MDSDGELLYRQYKENAAKDDSDSDDEEPDLMEQLDNDGTAPKVLDEIDTFGDATGYSNADKPRSFKSLYDVRQVPWNIVDNHQVDSLIRSLKSKSYFGLHLVVGEIVLFPFKLWKPYPQDPRISVILEFEKSGISPEDTHKYLKLFYEGKTKYNPDFKVSWKDVYSLRPDEQPKVLTTIVPNLDKLKEFLYCFVPSIYVKYGEDTFYGSREANCVARQNIVEKDTKGNLRKMIALLEDGPTKQKYIDLLAYLQKEYYRTCGNVLGSFRPAFCKNLKQKVLFGPGNTFLCPQAPFAQNLLGGSKTNKRRKKRRNTQKKRGSPYKKRGTKKM